MTAVRLIIQYTVILLSIFTIALNTLGIYLLCLRTSTTNSKFLLINLASSEILLSMAQTAFYSISILTGLERYLVFYKVLFIGVLYYYSAMFLLTADRLAAILHPLKYRVSVTTRRLTRVVLAMWLFDMFVVASLFISDEWFFIFERYIWFTMDVSYFILCCVTYGVIFYKMRSRRRFEISQPEVQRQQLPINRNRKFFKVVAMIIVSFIFLIMIPDLIFFHSKLSGLSLNTLFHDIVYIVWLTGFIADPVIFIFLQDDLRSLLRSKLCRFNRAVADVPIQPAHQDTAL